MASALVLFTFPVLSIGICFMDSFRFTVYSSLLSFLNFVFSFLPVFWAFSRDQNRCIMKSYISFLAQTFLEFVNFAPDNALLYFFLL